MAHHHRRRRDLARPETAADRDQSVERCDGERVIGGAAQGLDDPVRAAPPTPSGLGDAPRLDAGSGAVVLRGLAGRGDAADSNAGHRPPYRAVVSLAQATGHYWRTIRAKLILAGITDPLRELPDLHALLDVVEASATEQMSTEERDKFNFQMYRPDPSEKPVGFDEDEQLDAFAAFEAVAGGLK